MSKQRVVVTGLGALTPVGNTVASSWAGILEGRSGVRRIDHFDARSMASQIAATLRDFDAAQFIPAKEIKKINFILDTIVEEICGENKVECVKLKNLKIFSAMILIVL